MKRINIYLLGLIAIIIICISCEKDTKVIDHAIIPLTFSEKEVIESSNNFSIEIFKNISLDTNDNVFISPLSIGMAIAMTYNGSAGETKSEMEKVLGFENADSNSINTAYKNIYNNLLSCDEKVELLIANAIWYKQEYSVKETFKSIIEDSYYAEISPINTIDPSSKEIINSWVEEKTNNKIKDLINEVKPSDVMFLVNTIYFNAIWKYEFDSTLTFDGKFYLENGSDIDCKMMRKSKVDLNIFKNTTFTLAELPYGDGLFNMVILLPSEDKTVNDIIESIKTSELDSFINNSSAKSVDLEIPKFKMAYKQDLNSVLITMGMPTAFSDEAEFPNLFNEINSKLIISRVKHKTYIEVDEKGTEAAAATAVVIELTALPENEVLFLNKPFIFLIRENTTGVILFAGKLMQPINQ